MVSIISSHYGTLAYFQDCYNSVVTQSLTDFEWIIVYDGKESDNTFEDLKVKVRNDKRIFLVSCGMNMGAGYARNIGIELAKGDYITFIDTDDFWARTV